MMGFSNSFVSLAWKIWLVFGYVKFQGCKGFIECTFRGSIMYFMGANSWKFWRLFIYEKQGILWIMSLFAASCPWMKRRKGTRRIGEFYGCLKPQWGGCTFVNHAIPSNWISFRNPPFQPIWFFGIITKGPLFFPKMRNESIRTKTISNPGPCGLWGAFPNGLYGFVSPCVTWRACWNWENWGCMCYVKAEINNENKKIESMAVWCLPPPVGKFGDVITPSVEAEINIIHRTVPPSSFPQSSYKKIFLKVLGGGWWCKF